MDKPPHPDMEAKKFIDFCLKFFENQGTEIKKWKESWGSGSINFSEYKKIKDKTGSKVEAVLGTWGGKISSERGFMLLEVEIDEYESGVNVMFARDVAC